MNKIVSPLAGVVLLLLLASGILTRIVDFFTWFLMLQYTGPETSIFGEIIVRVLTFIVSYNLVGIIFSALGFFNSRAMKILYFIISSLLGFIIAYIVWSIEQHIVIIGIVLGAIVLASIAYFVIKTIKERKKHKKQTTMKSNL